MPEVVRAPRQLDPFADRPAPWSPEAEISVLGGMLIDPDAVAKAIEILTDEMLYREANRRVFRAMQRLFERGEVIDPVTLTEELKGRGELESVGGPRVVAELMEAVPTAANIEYHAKIVKDRALLRQLIQASTATIQDVHGDTGEQVGQTIDRAEQRIFAIAQAGIRKGFIRLKQLLMPSFERFEQRQLSGLSITGVASGFRDLDDRTAGFQRADLIVVAGRPSMGKTAFVLNVTEHAVLKNQAKVAVFSLEMSQEQLVERLFSSVASVDSYRLRTGRLSDEELQRLATAAGYLNTADVWIDDTPGISPMELRAKARRLKAEVDVDLLVVDYLQLMSGPPNTENRVQEISAISRGLKAVAKELNVPVIALSQLSRAPEQRADRRPILADLRESGSIEQDADLVLFLYRPEMYREKDEKGDPIEGKAELMIGKNRNGPTGAPIQLYFRKEFTRFESIEKHRKNGGG